MKYTFACGALSAMLLACSAPVENPDRPASDAAMDRALVDDRSSAPDVSDAGVSVDTGVILDTGVIVDTGVLPPCPAGQQRCAGECVDVQSSAMHCGGCDNACPRGANATATCAAGACALRCAAGFADCDMNAANGCESDRSFDLDNCGMCGVRCSLANATAACTDGMCGIGACRPGFANCDGNAANGCEADLGASSAHCGACNSACPMGQACNAGRCELVCTAPARVCGSGAGARCVDTNTDTANCGTCGNACPTGANASARCASGVCGLTCMPGFANCDGNASNGCEVDLRSSATHCGTCGTPCVAGATCTAGVCVASATCRAPGVLISRAPSGTEVLCDDPTNATCEQDFERLCPAGWHLCTRLEHNARNTGWTHVATTAERALGVIYCRAGGAAGHLTIPDAPASNTPLSTDTGTNCYYGSSRPSCPSGFGCNEQNSQALCCAPAPLCGNGRVDSPEEECDDGNMVETDDCLNSCTWRVPTSRGLTGTNC